MDRDCNTCERHLQAVPLLPICKLCLDGKNLPGWTPKLPRPKLLTVNEYISVIQERHKDD